MNQKRSAGNLIVLGPVQWIYLVIFLLVVAPLTVGSLYADKLCAAYLRAYFVPRIQRQFGFKLQPRQIFYFDEPWRVFVVTDLQPNGIMAKAGVKDGDIPVSTFYMSDIAFYRKIERAEIYPVEISLISLNEYEKLGHPRDLLLSDRVRHVSIPRLSFEDSRSSHIFPLTPAEYGKIIAVMLALIVTIVVWRRLYQ